MAAITSPAVSGGSPNELVLRAATAAYLGRYRGQTRLHSESDLRVFLHWCAETRFGVTSEFRRQRRGG